MVNINNIYFLKIAKTILLQMVVLKVTKMLEVKIQGFKTFKKPVIWLFLKYKAHQTCMDHAWSNMHAVCSVFFYGIHMLSVGGRELPRRNWSSETAHRAPVSPSTDSTASVPQSRALCHHPHSFPGESHIITQKQSGSLFDQFKFNSLLLLQRLKVKSSFLFCWSNTCLCVL